MRFAPQSAIDAIPPRIDAWVTPPAYTGKAPIFLTSDANQAAPVFTVPEGSDVALRVTGGSGEETLGFTDASGNVRDIAANAPAGAGQAGRRPARRPTAARQFAGKLDRRRHAVAEVRRRRRAQLGVRRDPGQAAGDPLLRRAEARASTARWSSNYEIEDDYGAASADGRVRAGRSRRQRTRIRSTRRRRCRWRCRAAARKRPAAKSTRDLTEHVWAGAKVKLTLKATDDAGQEARSETKTIVLPERPFSNPLARAVIEQRRILALDANQKRRVLDLMDAITLQAGRHVRQHVALSRHHERAHAAQDGRDRRRSCATSSPISGRSRSASRTATFRPPRSGCARRRRR